MAVEERRTKKPALSIGQKFLYGGLLVLEFPVAMIFLPAAAVLVLTGVLAPLAMMLFAVGTWPFSQAMKLRTAWKSAPVQEMESNEVVFTNVSVVVRD